MVANARIKKPKTTTDLRPNLSKITMIIGENISPANSVAEITNAIGGTITMTMPAIETSKLVHSRYVYSINLTDLTDTTRIMSGQVLVSSE